MNQADVSKLISQLRIAVRPTHRRLKNPNGPEGRLLKLRKTITALVKHERIELNYNRADEARGYAELLISNAIRHGDRHKETMELANYWLLEKQLVHKLFKVLAPRFESTNLAYTRMYKAPREYPGIYYKRSVLELRGNPYPSLLPDLSTNRNLLHNVLLDEARKDYRREKLAEIANKIAAASTPIAELTPPTEATPVAESTSVAESAPVAEPKVEIAEKQNKSA
ncbi:39S ribosomal protein L17, mitochondrial-like [Teleopsis dalmanni]|uniref:39S ribosomal protein L17, mitochondrial-like n=1 Tax=Teleopsis dalmanni TaxID=139649 RepID=UPI0018CF00E0|nr:39S ribosomal protein L17, mitochondrial-like [Teleopsis dalmanni]XP_037953568.1 39S ribosomal protein L17, mitochondrial-like [Teleopsis dalmanni]XP_037959704.1 39S ribosomal protein L17, mitochondrial-like [Teleopsis dalmanni]